MITSKLACQAAATKLGLGDVITDFKNNPNGWGHVPPGCSMWGSKVHYNYNAASTRSCDPPTSKYCICTEGFYSTQATGKCEDKMSVESISSLVDCKAAATNLGLAGVTNGDWGHRLLLHSILILIH